MLTIFHFSCLINLLRVAHSVREYVAEALHEEVSQRLVIVVIKSVLYVVSFHSLISVNQQLTRLYFFCSPLGLSDLDRHRVFGGLKSVFELGDLRLEEIVEVIQS